MDEGLAVTFFPYTLLDEGDLKRLCLYVSQLRLVQVDPETDPALPPELRAGFIIQPVAPVTDGPTLERIRLALRAYRHLGTLRPEGGLVECLSAFDLHDDPEGSFRRLRARLKGVPKSTPQGSDLVSSAVVLLLAHEVDREHLELESRLRRVQAMETALAETLGLPDDEGGRLTVAEVSGENDLERRRSEQAAQRLRAWTRLSLDRMEKSAVRPLTTSTAVMDEIWERLPPHLAAMPFMPSRAGIDTRLLCRLPDPWGLPFAAIMALRERLMAAAVLLWWWQALAAAFQALEMAGSAAAAWPALRRGIEGAAGAFSEHWPAGHPPGRALELSVTSYPRLPATMAFALAAGLRGPAPDLLCPEGKNGLSLLLSPERKGGSLWP
jgi:hypothetical protein